MNMTSFVHAVHASLCLRGGRSGSTHEVEERVSGEPWHDSLPSLGRGSTVLRSKWRDRGSHADANGDEDSLQLDR